MGHDTPRKPENEPDRKPMPVEPKPVEPVGSDAPDGFTKGGVSGDRK